MQPTVLVPWPDLEVPDGLDVGVYSGSEDVDPSGVEIFVAPYGGRGATMDLLTAMPALRILQVLSAGYDDVLPHLPHGVALHSGRGLHDASTAEHAVALILAAQRELPRWHDDQRAGRWSPERTSSLADSRVLLVGHGSIGRAIETRLAPFEVAITSVARTARPAEGVHGIEDLDRLLPDADIVCVVTPLTEATRGLFDDHRLGLMADGALLVNVGRGAVVDTAALLRQAGRVRAALDVVDPEPLPAEHPLYQAAGVLLTPHVAGGSATFHPRARRFVTEQLRRFVDGRELENRVET